MNKKQKFKFIKNFKLGQTPEELCGTKEKNPDTYHLLEFVKEVYQIGFKEDPNYDKLKFLLTRSILDAGQVPNNEYDWIKP